MDRTKFLCIRVSIQIAYSYQKNQAGIAPSPNPKWRAVYIRPGGHQVHTAYVPADHQRAAGRSLASWT
jgi:hypothetical protein